MQKFKLTILAIYLALGLSLLYPYADLDWGWHYKYGQYFAQTGQILKQDVFSWTLGGYPLSNHSWSFDLLVYYVHLWTGFSGLYYLGMVIFLLIFYLLVQGRKLHIWQTAMVALFYVKLTQVTYFQGLRTQVLGLGVLVVMLRLLESGFEKPRNYFWLPLLFLIWVNMHASFVAGLVIMIIYFICLLGDFMMQGTIFRKDRLLMNLAGIILSLVATLINPFATKVYEEALRHVGSPWLSLVSEWKPFGLLCTNCQAYWVFGFFGLLAVMVVWRFRWRLVPLSIVVLILFVMGLSHLRYMAMAGMAGLLLFIRLLPNIGSVLNTKIIQSLITTCVLLLIGLNITKIKYPGYQVISGGLFKALREVPPTGNGFNNYDWGGVLLGFDLVPKVFVYGHMHLWEKDGFSPFAEAIAIQNNYDNIFSKYNFDWLVIRADSTLAKKINKDISWRIIYLDQISLYATRTQ